MKHKLLILLMLFVGFSGFLLLRHITSVTAATTITVNSTADTSINDGVCTLREAITASNTNTASGVTVGECAAGSGAGDTIAFTIAGAGPHTIQPNSGLPPITETVTIDGYTEPGAVANTAISPKPLNGTLMIEIAGTNAGANTDGLIVNPGVTGVVLRGLVINSFSFRGVGANGGGSGTIIEGCYIGTDRTGLIDKGNADTGIQLGPNTRIGGLDPEDRNIISGNDGGGASPNTGDDNWIIQGNYVGVGADGKTTISNSAVGGNGALSIDNSNGHTVGGTALGATNVISGNRSFGIFPDNTTRLVIQGNIIGPDWEGEPLVSNPQLGGIGFPPLSGPITNSLIGGVTAGASNLIAENNGPGIVVLNTTNGGAPLNSSANISILGNKIFNNRANAGYILSTAGLGIDLATIDVSNFSVSKLGPTPNDTADPDTGANVYMNFPVITNISSTGDDVTFTYNLDINNAEPGATGYRVEFFANGAADPSGYGEGETFVGADTVSGDVTGRTATFSNTGLGLGAYAFAATTTMTDVSADGFGHSSEFSAVLAATITADPASGALADTGHNVYVYFALAAALMLTGGVAWRRFSHQ